MLVVSMAKLEESIGRTAQSQQSDGEIVGVVHLCDLMTVFRKVRTMVSQRTE